MSVSGIGATPQPEQNGIDPKIEKQEQFAESIFQNLNKNGDDQIDEKDGLDNSMLKALKQVVGSTLTLDNLKKAAGMLSDFTYTKEAKYNGMNAQVTYNIWGQIKSVNTGANNIEEARQHMGLDKEHVVKVSDGSGFKDMMTYGKEYKKNNGVQKEYFVWNSETKSMDFNWGSWSDKVHKSLIDAIDAIDVYIDKLQKLQEAPLPKTEPFRGS